MDPGSLGIIQPGLPNKCGFFVGLSKPIWGLKRIQPKFFRIPTCVFRKCFEQKPRTQPVLLTYLIAWGQREARICWLLLWSVLWCTLAWTKRLPRPMFYIYHIYIHTYIHNITLHYITSHYITLHYMTWRDITLPYLTLPYITWREQDAQVNVHANDRFAHGSGGSNQPGRCTLQTPCRRTLPRCRTTVRPG